MPVPVATPAHPELRSDVSPAPEPGCGACPHPEAAHDPIALRYCRATVASALDRSCVCRIG